MLLVALPSSRVGGGGGFSAPASTHPVPVAVEPPAELSALLAALSSGVSYRAIGQLTVAPFQMLGK